MTLEQVSREFLTKSDALVYFAKLKKNLDPNAFKKRQKFAKSPKNNICSETLSKFGRFSESSDKFANMAILLRPDYHGNMLYNLLFSCVS